MYVLAHDGGCEGFSGPMLIVEDKDEAIGMARLSGLSVFEVPVWPNHASAEWYNVKPIWPTNP